MKGWMWEGEEERKKAEGWCREKWGMERGRRLGTNNISYIFLLCSYGA